MPYLFLTVSNRLLQINKKGDCSAYLNSQEVTDSYFIPAPILEQGEEPRRLIWRRSLKRKEQSSVNPGGRGKEALRRI